MVFTHCLLNFLQLNRTYVFQSQHPASTPATLGVLPFSLSSIIPQRLGSLSSLSQSPFHHGSVIPITSTNTSFPYMELQELLNWSMGPSLFTSSNLFQLIFRKHILSSLSKVKEESAKLTQNKKCITSYWILYMDICSIAASLVLFASTILVKLIQRIHQ